MLSAVYVCSCKKNVTKQEQLHRYIGEQVSHSKERIQCIDIYGNKQYYKILSNENKTVAFVQNRVIGRVRRSAVPSEIMCNDTVYTVKEIEDFAFRDCWNLRSVILPDSLEAIGVRAFERCYSLKNIKIPDGVRTIDDSAFMRCSSLSSVKLPSSLTYIGKHAFYKCSNLKQVIFKNPIGNRSDVQLEIDRSAFKDCKKLKSIQLPNTLKYIGWYCFENCKSLKSIVFPPQVEVIEYSIFRNCSSLVDITLPDSLRKINNYAFSDCASLEKLVIPASTRLINSCAFSGSNNLRSIIVESDTPPKVYEYTFYDRHYNNPEHKVSVIKNRFIIYVLDESLELYKSHKL